MALNTPAPNEQDLLAELASAIQRADRPVQEIEIGITLSIAIGRQRPAVSCGGCSTPLEFEGIPTRTNLHLSQPFRLIYQEQPTS
jgi:hypothetical protein